MAVPAMRIRAIGAERMAVSALPVQRVSTCGAKTISTTAAGMTAADNTCALR